MTINNKASTTEQHTLPEPQASIDPKRSSEQRRMVIGISIGVILILAVLVTSIVMLLQPATDTAKIRDVFIIFMALETLLIGLVLVILIVQLARLINLLQNEVKPILESTNETVSHLRGTAAFLSDNLAEPVIKLNEYMAGLTQLLQVIGIARKKPKN
jgi:hypothetical protein